MAEESREELQNVVNDIEKEMEIQVNYQQIVEDLKVELVEAADYTRKRHKATTDKRLKRIEHEKYAAYTAILHSILMKENEQLGEQDEEK